VLVKTGSRVAVSRFPISSFAMFAAKFRFRDLRHLHGDRVSDC
jgi:hypothetical protein